MEECKKCKWWLTSGCTRDFDDCRYEEKENPNIKIIKGKRYDKYCKGCGKEIGCYRHKDVKFDLDGKEICITLYLVSCSDYCTYKPIDIIVD